MVNRTQKLSKNDHLFLFGARGPGKSTLIQKIFKQENVLWIDLLTEADEERFGKNPDELSAHLLQKQYSYVVIDEIQKFPKLLDIVHKEIERSKSKTFFILTGSSARKLKRSHANLLGGRAISYSLFPFTHLELAQDFELHTALNYGTLPLVFARKEDERKEEFLRSYIKNYIVEEVLVEQLVRQIEPFKDFLEVAAQMNGEIINYAKIGRDVGASDQTVKTFFQILEDTLLGFSLPPFHRSIRKRQRESPKFYFFDPGVVRAFKRQLKIKLQPKTSDFGKAFEHFVILEIMRACEYLRNDYRLSYLRTKDDAEIDVVIERPGLPDYLIEIKSTDHILPESVTTISKFINDWDRTCEGAVWSLDKLPKKILGVSCYYWTEGFQDLFNNKTTPS